jgi:hypothetical protein
MPREPYHDDVQTRDQQEPRGVRKADSVQLIHDEKSEDDYGGGVEHGLLSQKSRDQESFDNAVTQEIKGGEVLRANRKVLYRVDEILCDEVSGSSASSSWVTAITRLRRNCWLTK